MAEFAEVMKQMSRMCRCKRPHCNQCGLYSSNNQTGDNCDHFIVRNYEQAEEIIMDWAKKHPMQTNADKFKEVFGMELFNDGCGGVSCPSDDTKCKECIYKDFWQQEYKEPKE